MANKISIEISVDENNKASTALKSLESDTQRFVSAVNQAGGSAAAGIKPFYQQLKETRAALGIVEESSAKAAATVVREFQASDKQVETLRQSLIKTRAEALKLQGVLATRGQDGASRAAADIASKSGRGLESIDFDPSSFARVDASARSAKGALTAIRDENKNLQSEATKSGGLLKGLVTNIQGVGTPLSSIVSGILGANLITSAIQGAVAIGKAWMDARKAAKESQEQLIRAGISSGESLQLQIEGVQLLSDKYVTLGKTGAAALLATAAGANKTPVTESTAAEAAKTIDNATTRALKALSSVEIAEAAKIQGVRTGIKGDDVKKALSELEQGNTQPLLGVSDAEVQARFAAVIGKLPSAFTEEEKRLARINELIVQQAGGFGAAATAVERYRETLGKPVAKGGNGDVFNPLDGSVESLKRLSQDVAAPTTSVMALAQIERTAEEQRSRETKEELDRLQLAKSGTEAMAKFRADYHQRRDAEEAKDAAEQERRAAQEKTRAKETAARLRTARDATRDFFSDIQQRVDKENPFTSLYQKLDSSVERSRKNFGAFGDDFALAMSRIEQESIKVEMATARFQSLSSAMKLMQEARRLEASGGLGLTGPEDRQIDVLKAQIANATAGISALASAESIRAGFTRAPADLARQQAEEIERLKRRQAEAARTGFADPSRAARQAEEIEELKRRQSLATVANAGGVDPAYLAGQQFAALEKLQRAQAGQPEGNAKNAALELIANQLTQLFSGLDAQTRAKLDGATREKFAGAFDTSAKAAARGVEEAIERQKVGDLIQTDARELARQVKASGLTDAAKNKELLAVTGSLSERELTPDLRKARVTALREGANFESQKEDRAQKDREFLYGKTDEKGKLVGEPGLLQKLAKFFGDKGIKIEGAPVTLNVNVADGLEQVEGVLPPAMKAELSSGDRPYTGYAPGFRM